ncbi:MAG: hypothetical protein H0W90_07950 [Actinobacteria bacterium]|nr:hypothetical protein [Actinomycetota bacterium]
MRWIETGDWLDVRSPYSGDRYHGKRGVQGHLELGEGSRSDPSVQEQERLNGLTGRPLE